MGSIANVRDVLDYASPEYLACLANIRQQRERERELLQCNDYVLKFVGHTFL